MNTPDPHLPTLFSEARACASEAERAAYLERACAGRPELRDEVEALLRAHSAAGGFLGAAAPDSTIPQPPTEGPGTIIGPYRLVEEIGEGGMGTVYLAQQIEPVKRLVALKVIKAGMDSRQVIARFEAERQALALMDHPNIAKVLDGGTTPAGRPYFVMELVKGVPITKFCDERRLTPRQRLDLFLPVCHAIQHAHQKGIIHRDIKPTNVLVALYDGQPVPKVIDFGVAKATGQPLTERTLVTGLGAVVGTPEYMSPEQAELNQLDIDTRSDVYSLGVLLYELLTGTTPLTRKRMKEAALLEVLRVIREEEAQRPSTRLSTTEELPSIAASRGTEPARLSRLMRGELDWVVMKALEKDRNRRYDTANGFYADIQRYLADEPVHAVPPSAGYRFRKFARRNKRALVTASAIGLALLLAVGSLGWVVRDRAAGRVRTTAEVNQFLERAEGLYAENKLPEAEAEVQKARGVLEAGRGDEELDRRVRQWLTDLETAAKLEELRLDSYDLEDRDRAYADYAHVFGECGIDVEALPDEEVTARIAASPIKLDLVLALGGWASLLTFDPRPQDPARWQRLRAIARAADPDPWRLRLSEATEAKDLKALRELADGADPARSRTRTLAYLGNSLRAAGDAEAAVAFLRRAQRQHPGDFSINSNLALRLSELKPPAWDESIAFRRVAVAVRPRSAWARNVLGVALRNKNRFDEAIVEYHEAIRLRPGYAHAHNNLGACLATQKKFEEAVACYRKAIELDPKHVLAHTNLGVAFEHQGKLNEAVAAYRTAIAIDPKYARAHYNLGSALHDQKKLDDAVAAYREAIAIDPNDSAAHNNLGNALSDQGKLDEAVTAYRRAIAIDPNDHLTHLSLGSALHDQKKLDDAVAAYREGIRLKPDYAIAHNNLGVVLKDQNKWDEAITEYRKAIAIDREFGLAYFNLGFALAEQKKLDEAIDCYRKAIALNPEDHNSYRNLGWCYFNQKKWDDAVAAHREAIRLKPDFAAAHSGLGNALKQQNKLDEAIDCYKKAFALEAKGADDYCSLGDALKDQNKLGEAIEWYKKAIALDPKHADAHNVIAIALKRQNKPDEAVEWYKKAIALDPKNANYRHNLGLAVAAQNKLDAAVAAYREAIALNPKSAESHYCLGNAVRDQDKLDDAIAAYREAIRLKRDHVSAHNNLGLVLRNQNKLDDALVSFREAIRFKPDFVPAHYNLGLVLHDQKKLDEAIAAYREAVRLKPDYPSAHYNLGSALQSRGKVDDAIAAYREAVRVKPDFADAYINLGNALADKGRYDDAVAALREGIRLKPKESLARNSLGWALAGMGRVQEAIASYEEAIRLKEDHILALGNLAWVLAAGPDPHFWDGKRAVELMNKVETLGGKTALSRRITGLAQYRAGDWKASRAALEDAMKLAKGGDSYHWFCLALVHQRLGNTAETRAWYDKAVQWMDENQPKNDELRRFRMEAAKVLGVAVEVAPPPREKK